MNMVSAISAVLLDDEQRVRHPAALFGVRFSLSVEPLVYATAGVLSLNYNGGYWHFQALSNGAFYMAPEAEDPFRVTSPNGYSGIMSGDGLGLTACLFTYSRLSFCVQAEFARRCASQYHLLREYVFDHDEADSILRAID